MIVDSTYPTFDCDMVREWISRAKTYPLSLRCYASDPLEGSSLGVVADIIPGHASRWSRIYIDSSFDLFNWIYSLRGQAVKPDLESLHWLELKVPKDSFFWIRRAILDKAPNLRRFALTTGYTEMLGPKPFVDFATFQHTQLTDLQLDGPEFPVPVVVKLLRGCPSLVFMTISTNGKEEYDGQDTVEDSRICDSIVVHRSLTHFIFNAYEDRDLAYLCARTRAPNLSSLDITCDAAGIDMESFRQFLSCSSCRLRSFNFCVMQIGTVDLGQSMIRFLRHPSVANSLERLEFWGMNDDSSFHPQFADDLISYITLSPTNTTLPRLRKFAVSAELGTHAGLFKVAKMLKSRLAPSVIITNGADGGDVVPLQEANIHLRIIRPYWTEDDSELRSLRDKGLELALNLEWEQRDSEEEA